MGVFRDISIIFWPRAPKPLPAITRERQQPTRQGDGPRLVPIGGRLFVDDKDKDNNIEFQISYTRADQDNAFGQRAERLTDNDRNELDKRGLSGNIEKAAEIKALWATGMTAIEIVKYFNGRYGYGERTIKTYVAAFNAALPGGGAGAQ